MATEIAMIKAKGEVPETFAQVKAVVNKYNWNDELVRPYGSGIPIKAMLQPFEEFDEYTPSSQSILISELNGLIRILNAWLRREESPKVRVRFTAGKYAGQIREIPEYDLGMYRRLEIIEEV